MPGGFFVLGGWAMVWWIKRKALPKAQELACTHRTYHYETSMPNIDHLRALFSGTMSCDEYSKIANDEVTTRWRVCNKCGHKTEM